jgi:hypothetical protein
MVGFDDNAAYAAHIDEPQQFGGIRIEDNLHITATDNEHLNRMAFASTQPKTL